MMNASGRTVIAGKASTLQPEPVDVRHLSQPEE